MEPAEERGGPGGLGSENNAPRQWRGAPPHRLGQERWGLGEGSHLQLYPTGQRRVNDGGRAGCPGQEAPRQGERESRVSQSSSPPPPPSPPPPRTTDHRPPTTSSHGRSTQRGGKSEPQPRGRDQNGQPHPDCTEGGEPGGVAGDQVWLRRGLSCMGGPGGGDSRGTGRRGGQEGLLVSMASLPMGGMEG